MAYRVLTCKEFEEYMKNGLISVGEFKEGLPFAPVTVKDPETGKSSRLVVQACEMKAPYGITLPWSAKDNGLTLQTIDPDAKCTMDLSFDDIENRPSMQMFKNGVDDLGNLVIKEMTKRSQQLFNKQISEESMREELFKSNLRSETAKSKAAFRLNLNRKKGEFNFKTCDNNYNLMDISTIETRGAKVTAIIKCNGVWKVGKSFGISWAIDQMRVIPGVKFQGHKFREDVERLATPEMIEAQHETRHEVEGDGDGDGYVDGDGEDDSMKKKVQEIEEKEDKAATVGQPIM